MPFKLSMLLQLFFWIILDLRCQKRLWILCFFCDVNHNLNWRSGAFFAFLPLHFSEVVPQKKSRARENWRREKETWWEKLGGTNLASPADILRRASRVPSIQFGSCMLCNLWHLSSFVIRACRQLPSKYGAFLVAFSLHRTLLEFIRYSYRD